MDKKRKTNQVALLGAAFYFNFIAANEDERASARRDIDWRLRGIGATDLSRALSIARALIAKEPSHD